MDKATCAVCGKSMLNINNRHLATHQLTAAEYKVRYPDSPLMSEQHAKKLSDRSVVSNASRKGMPRSETTKQNMRDGQARYHATHDSKPRGPMSETQKELLSALAHQRYADGFVHPNLGKHHSEELKQKISVTLTGRQVGPEPALKAVATKRARGYDMAPNRGRSTSEETKAKIKASFEAGQADRCRVSRTYMLEEMARAKLTLLNDVSENYFWLRCDVCAYEFTRRANFFFASSFHERVCDQCFPKSPVSQQENAVAALIATLTDKRIVRSDMETISPLELDILIPDSRLAIEYCGLYWHSEKPRFYHQYKFNACQKQGIRLLTIFEDEWLESRDIVESMLRNALGGALRSINARSCQVKPVADEHAIAFLRDNHLQGRGRSQVKLGLWLGEELVAVMSFIDGDVSHRGNGWEINRFCSKLGCSVRGGASKLFKEFIRQYQPDKVTSYADLRWGEGKVYERLGFRHVGNTVPNYWYVNGERRYHRYALRKTASDPVDIPEWQLRQQQGWNRLWDYGHAKWLYQKFVDRAG